MIWLFSMVNIASNILWYPKGHNYPCSYELSAVMIVLCKDGQVCVVRRTSHVIAMLICPVKNIKCD